MDAIIFDLDGVLVDSMPTHVRAWQEAFENVAGISVTERDIYLLEGMRGMELIARIFEKKGGDMSLAKKVNDEKNKVFRSTRSSRPFDGAAELLDRITCPKALVSGSARQDVEAIVKEAFGANKFAVTLTADDVNAGKPDPTAFVEAANRIGSSPSSVTVVENAPLGALAAEKAGMQCFIALNNTPLVPSDFGDIVKPEKMFRTTDSLGRILVGLCA
jgi:HAD superfamily hydrolase (TIGR01509 family)